MCRTSITRWPDHTAARAACIATLLALGACSRESSGPSRTEQRGVDAFHSIDLRGATDATVQAGAASSVTLVADADTLQATRTYVQNGMLIVENQPGRHWLRGASKIEVRITVPALNALAMNGAGNVTISGVNSSALALALQGTGHLTASGKTATLNARVNGAGDMDLSHLDAGDASIIVNGTGNLSANVAGSLQATINGVGSITYAGKPHQVDSKINGAGRIVAATEPGG